MIFEKVWSGWNKSWNALDRLVEWHVIGDTGKLYRTVPEVEEVGNAPTGSQLGATPAPTQPSALLDFTPVTRHLKDFASDPDSLGESRHEFTMVHLASGSVPKDRQYPESNEDAYAWEQGNQRAAVFDGATESFAAQRWVELIRSQWLEGKPTWFQDAQSTYGRDIEELNLSWAQLEAAERGSYTTLVSVEAVPLGLRITTLGDSCIFLLSEGEILGCAPYVSNGEFFASPQALSTKPQDDINSALNTNTFTLTPETVAGKQILLATDALSQWLLITSPQERLSRLLHALTTNDLVTLVVEERATGAMKTDDTTALLLDIEVGGEK